MILAIKAFVFVVLCWGTLLHTRDFVGLEPLLWPNTIGLTQQKLVVVDGMWRSSPP